VVKAARAALLVTDPRVFFSAVAATTGALVAIVGGLLVSRLVALSSERTGVERRIGELATGLTSLDSAIERIDQRRLARVRRFFRDLNLRNLVFAHRSGDEIELDAPVGATDPEFAELAETYPKWVREAFESIEAAFPGSERPLNSADELREGGHPFLR
jgi:hypothetical protein